MKEGEKSIRKADLLYKYVKGNASSEELKEIGEILSRHNPDQKLFADIFPEDLVPRPDDEKNRVWQSLEIYALRAKKRSLLRWTIGYAAACVIAATGLAILLQPAAEKPEIAIRSLINTPSVELPSGEILEISEGTDISRLIAETATDTESEESTPITFTKVIVPPGTDYRLTFPDGSTAYIFPGSELKFSSRFEENRHVELTGEAFFEVAANPELPFRVAASGFEITVLGTSFNVAAYANTGVVETALVTGSVDVAGTVILPNTVASIDIASGNIYTRDCSGDDYSARTQSLFVFRDMSISRILDELKLWYDFDYTFQDQSISEELFTFGIGRDKGISEILRRLELTGVVDFHAEGMELKVSAK